MPTYHRNGKTYNIPDSEVEGFEKTYPDATQKYEANGKNYNIPVSERSGFLSTYKNAKPFGVEQVSASPDIRTATIDSSSVQGMDSVEDYKPEVNIRNDTPFNLQEAMNGPTDSERKEQERKRIEEQVLQSKKIADAKHLNAKGDKIQADYDAVMENPFLAINDPMMGVVARTPKQVETEKKVDLARATSERTNDAFNMIEEAKKKGATNFVSGFGRGFWEKASKASTWDFGARDLQSNLAVSIAADKYANDQPLSGEEEALLDAVALEAAAQGEFSGDLGRGYKAGGTTAESIPFMAEFMINPATGTGSAVGKAATKRIISNFGKEAAKNTIGKIARGASRVVGDVAGAGIMTGTTGIMRASADAVDRTTGDVKSSVDDDGYYRFGGTEEGEGGIKSFAKAYGASTIENFSEMFGNYLSPIGIAAGGVAGRAMNKVGLGKVNDIIGRVKASDIAKIVGDFQGRTQWNGTIGEYLEEQAGMAMNALTVGDNSLSDLVDVDTQIDTFLGVSAFGGLFSGIKTAGYARQKYVEKSKLSDMDRRASSVLGEDWPPLKEQIDNADDAELASILSTTMSDTSIDDWDKQLVLLYAGRLKAYHGASLADLKRKTEGDTPDEVVQSQFNFDAGYKLAEADRNEKRKASKELRDIESKLDDEFLSSDEDVRYELMRQRSEAGEDVSNELSYINAQSKFDGMIQGIRDAINEKVAQSNEYITRLTHQDGNVYDVTLTLDENKHVFPVSGVIVADEDGIIDRKKSDSRFIVRDDQGNIGMRSVDDLYKLESTEHSEAIKEATTQSIREQESARYAEEIDAPSVEEKAEEVSALQAGSEIELNIDGASRVAIVQSVYSDGGIELRFEDKITGHDGKEKNVDVFTSDEITALIVPKVGVEVLENAGDIEKEYEKKDVSELESNSVVPTDEATAQQSVIPEEVPIIPLDDKGNFIYHRAPVETTLENVRSYGLDDSETDEFIGSQKADAVKRLDNLQKKKPKVGTNLTKYQSDKREWENSLADAQRQVDYWNDVDAQIQATRVQPGDVTAEAITSMGEPMNGEEMAAMMLGTGKLPLLFDDYKRETGFSNQDAKGMFGLFSAKSNGGMSIEQAGEKLMEMDEASGTNFFDQSDANAGRNAILDVISYSRTRGDLFGYIKGNRELMAEQERHAEYSAYENWVNDVKRMSINEYEADEEVFYSRTKEYFDSYNFDEIAGNIADDLIAEENDRRTEEPGIELIPGGSTEGIQGEFDQSTESGGVEQPEGFGVVGESQARGEGSTTESVLSGADVVGGEQTGRGVADVVFTEEPSVPVNEEREGLFDYAERVVEQEKINRDYANALNVVNEFAEKYAGATPVLVIKSKKQLREQMKAIGMQSDDIDKYEQWEKDGNTIAFYAPRYNRIILFDANRSKEELNNYLWHENAHKAILEMYGDSAQEKIDALYYAFEPLFQEEFFDVCNDYSDRPKEEQREECLVHLIEHAYSDLGENFIEVISRNFSKYEGIDTLNEIYNNIVYGKEYKPSFDRRSSDGDRQTKGKHEKRETMEMRNSNGDFGVKEESRRSWNDLRSIFEAGEERLRRKNESEPVNESSQENEDIAKREYEDSLDKIKNRMYRWQEAYQDSMLGLKKMQEAIEKESGEKLQYFEDAYMAENQMSSKSGYETDVYKDKFFIPIMDTVRALVKNGAKQKDVSRYVMAKHGLERNVVFAKRNAEREADDEFRDEMMELKKSWDKGEIELQLFDEMMEELNARKKDFYEGVYQKNRKRDFSGLKQLTRKEANFEEAAMEKVNAFEDAHSALCDVLWEKVNAATKQTLKKSYESGLMTKSTYDKVRGMFEYYVPLRGWNDKVASDVYEYILSEKSVFQAPVKTAFGRESLADDPFANIGNMAESGILQGNRNLMKQKFLNMVLNHPTSLATVKTMWYENTGSSDKPVWEQSLPDIKADATADEITQAIEDHESRMTELGRSGMAKKSTKGITLDYRASKREKNEHAVVVKSGGKEYVIFVNGNPRAAQAVNGLTNPDATDHKFMQIIGKINRQLAANFTTRNPAFVLSNMSRDVIFSTSAVWVKEDWKYAKRFDKNIVKNIGAITGLMARYKSGKLNMSNSRDRHFLEFLENGGETGYTALHNVDEYKKTMDRHVKKSNGSIGSLSSGAHAIIDAVSFMNRCAENVSRFTTYQTSREMGRGITESVRDAKEVTVNFNKKGAGGLGAGTFKSLFLFFNAAVQSLSNFKGLHDKSKAKFYTSIGGFAAAGILLPMINNFIIESLVGDEDDEMTDEERVAWKKKRDSYDNLPEWVRKNNFCLWVGGEYFITIPLPIEMRAFYGLGEMWYQMGRGNMNGVDGELDAKKVSLEMINQITELLPINPFGGNGDAISVLVPDAGKPFYQVLTNRDFFGKPIYKKNDYNDLMPAWTKAFSGTAKWMVNSAEFLNEVSGGDKYMQGGVNLNPATIEHVFEGYFGGMGKTANQLYKTISMIWDEDERMWRNVPVVNRFFAGRDNKISFRKVNDAYYQYMDEYKEIEQRLRGYENEAEMDVEKYAEKYDFLNGSKPHERYLLMKEYKTGIDAMRDAIKESNSGEKKEIEMEMNLLKMEMIEELGLIK